MPGLGEGIHSSSALVYNFAISKDTVRLYFKCKFQHTFNTHINMLILSHKPLLPECFEKLYCICFWFCCALESPRGIGGLSAIKVPLEFEFVVTHTQNS